LRELEQKLSEMTAANALSEVQRTSYESVLEEYKGKLKSYSHKEQRPFW